MKYFNPSYWFKLWLLSAPLFNDETIGINAKSIDNKKIKDWASNNTNLQSISQDMTFTNSSTNYQPYNLNQKVPNQIIDPFYQTEIETSTHKHRHEKSRIIKRGVNSDRENAIEFKQDIFGGYIKGEIYASFTPKFWEEVSYLKRTSNNKEEFIQSFKNKVTSGVWKDYRLEGVYDPSYEAMLGLGSSIWDNWININNVWQESSKNKMIRVEIKTWSQSGDRQFSFLNSHIRGDSVILSNPYLKPDLSSNFKTCIDPVDNNNDETILKAIKSKNPSVDTSQVYVKEKTINGKLDIGVKSDSNKYNINSSASCPNLQVKPETTTLVVSKPIQQTTTSTPQKITSISSSQHLNGYV